LSDGPRWTKRDGQRTRELVARASWENSDWYGRADLCESGGRFHHSAITPEHKQAVALGGDFLRGALTVAGATRGVHGDPDP
jgi:hypothetical protein